MQRLQDAGVPEQHASIGLRGRLDGLDSKITAVRWRLAIIGGAAGGILAVLASALPDIVAAFR